MDIQQITQNCYSVVDRTIAIQDNVFTELVRCFERYRSTVNIWPQQRGELT